MDTSSFDTTADESVLKKVRYLHVQRLDGMLNAYYQNIMHYSAYRGISFECDV